MDEFLFICSNKKCEDRAVHEYDADYLAHMKSLGQKCGYCEAPMRQANATEIEAYRAEHPHPAAAEAPAPIEEETEA